MDVENLLYKLVDQYEDSVILANHLKETCLTLAEKLETKVD